MSKKFTGYRDKNSRKIFDGDRVTFLHYYAPVTGWVKLTGLVKWSDSYSRFVVTNVRDEQGSDLCDRFLSDILCEAEVK